MNLSTQSHFTFAKELCDQYNVNYELDESTFPSIRIWPKEVYCYQPYGNFMDYPQISFVFFPEEKLVKVSNGKVLQYKDFNSYLEQMMDLHY